MGSGSGIDSGSVSISGSGSVSGSGSGSRSGSQIECTNERNRWYGMASRSEKSLVGGFGACRVEISGIPALEACFAQGVWQPAVGLTRKMPSL